MGGTISTQELFEQYQSAVSKQNYYTAIANQNANMGHGLSAKKNWQQAREWEDKANQLSEQVKQRIAELEAN